MLAKKMSARMTMDGGDDGAVVVVVSVESIFAMAGFVVCFPILCRRSRRRRCRSLMLQ